MDLEALKRPELQKSLEEGLRLGLKILADVGLDKDPALLAVLDGQTIAQAKGLTRDDLEVLYAYGFAFLANRDAERAEEVFLHLCLIDPLQSKNHYCLGVVRQMQERWDMAIDDFARFCALDATNPEGYLRIGECLTAQGDRTQARQMFDVALREAKKGRGPKNAVAQAELALASLDKED